MGTYSSSAGEVGATGDDDGLEEVDDEYAKLAADVMMSEDERAERDAAIKVFLGKVVQSRGAMTQAFRMMDRDFSNTITVIELKQLLKDVLLLDARTVNIVAAHFFRDNSDSEELNYHDFMNSVTKLNMEVL